jgi:hypothetical protein
VGRAVEGQHRLNLDREQVLDRLWEIANLSPEMTRGSITGQVKAIAMIIAMENFIPIVAPSLREEIRPCARPNLYLRGAYPAAGYNPRHNQ